MLGLLPLQRVRAAFLCGPRVSHSSGFSCCRDGKVDGWMMEANIQEDDGLCSLRHTEFRVWWKSPAGDQRLESRALRR